MGHFFSLKNSKFFSCLKKCPIVASITTDGSFQTLHDKAFVVIYYADKWKNMHFHLVKRQPNDHNELQTNYNFDISISFNLRKFSKPHGPKKYMTAHLPVQYAPISK